MARLKCAEDTFHAEKDIKDDPCNEQIGTFEKLKGWSQKNREMSSGVTTAVKLINRVINLLSLVPKLEERICLK